MTTTNPIVPPPELVQQWSDIKPMEDAVVQNWVKIAIQAARWGAEQELEACKQYMHDQDWFMSPTLRMSQLHNARRPKPLSLKEQALAALTQYMTGETILTKDSVDTIRRALEALDD